MTTPLGRLLEISRNAGAPPTPEEQADVARFRRRVGCDRQSAESQSRTAVAEPPSVLTWPRTTAPWNLRRLRPMVAAAVLLLLGGAAGIMTWQMADLHSLRTEVNEARDRAGRAEAKLEAAEKDKTNVEARLAELEKVRPAGQGPPEGITFTLSPGIVRSPKWEKTWKEFYDKDRSDAENLEWLTPRAPTEIRDAIRWMKAQGRSDGEILAAIRPPDAKNP